MARSDMFFKAAGQSTGAITGESVDKQFAGQMDIVDWSWGMTAPTAVGGQRTGRTLMGELKLVKRVDKASTALMSVMRNNEMLREAVLSVRKAGGVGAALPYYKMTLAQARITSYAVQSDVNDDGAPTLTEQISLTYKMVTIDHVPQGTAGGGGGGSSFTADAAPD